MGRFDPWANRPQRSTTTAYLPAGCHGKLTVLNLLSASVTKNQNFRPYRKNCALDRKMINTFSNCHDVLYQLAKFGEMNYARRLWEQKLVFFLCHAWSACAWGTLFKQELCDGLWVDFDAIFRGFFKGIVLSGALHYSNLRRQMAPQFSRNCSKELRKVQKSAEKFVRTTSYR